MRLSKQGFNLINRLFVFFETLILTQLLQPCVSQRFQGYPRAVPHLLQQVGPRR